jgi:predicted GNAT family acetyltransferase
LATSLCVDLVGDTCGMTTEPQTAPEVRENAAEYRFEIWLGGERAGMTVYEGEGPTLAFVHTEIDDRFGGRGLGSVLIRQALDTVRARGQAVLPYCPFVKAFIQKHPDYLDLVPPSKRATFGLPETVPAAEG